MVLFVTRVFHYRLLLLAVVIICCFTALIIRLYDVQVAEGQKYTDRLRDQTTVSIRLSPARGAITDRNGVALAENRSSFDVDFYLEELLRNYKRQHRGKLPMITVERKRKGKIETQSTPDIVRIVQENIDPIAQSLGFENRPDAQALREHYRIRANIPFQFRTDVDFTTLAKFSERNLGVPGIDIAARPVRTYNFGALASHVLGYVGKPQDKDQLGVDGYDLETVGLGGVEKTLDGQLQGKPGGKILRVNYRGYIDKEEGFDQPTVGNTVVLSLDARIQYIVEQAMRNIGRGAAVVMDPNTGDILAMASVPSFDPNKFIPSISANDWKALNSDLTTPLYNRAISTYAPGSTFKVLVTLAGLRSGRITPRTTFDCPGTLTIGNIIFGQDPHIEQGMFTMFDGLRVSSNTFFYQAGITTGIQNIDQMAADAGFGSLTEVPLPGERTGVVPGPEWMKKNNPRDRWSNAHTANVSIGQGSTLVTPIQMATFMSAVANGGTLYYPRLVQKVEDINGEIKANIPVRPRNTFGLKADDMNALHEALLGVVERGTGRRAGGIPGVKIAGKTGSASFTTKFDGRLVKDTRAWFYGFAPFDKPRYAFCILVEGGVAGGVSAAPIAHDILTQVFAMENGQPVNLDYVPPSQGNFQGMQEYVPADPNAANAAIAPTQDAPVNQPNDDDGAAASPMIPKRR